MSSFSPLAAAKAIAFVEAAGITDARRLIADFAAAGMVRTYALAMETVPVGGKATVLPRDIGVPVEHWRRIIRDGLVDDVWTGGTVRLAPGHLVGGEPEVRITGIRFSDKHLQTLVDLQLGAISKPQPPRKVKVAGVDTVDMGAAAELVDTVDTIGALPALVAQPAATPPRRRGPDVAAIPRGALVASIAQTQQATGLGRTKINELINEGTLASTKVGRSVRIEVASIMALLGLDA